MSQPVRGSVLAFFCACAFLAPVAGLEAQEPIFSHLLRLPGGDDRFGYPVSVTADLHTGEVFVTDIRDHRIVIFDAEGLFSFEIPGGDVFRSPRDVAVDPEGFILVVAVHKRANRLIELDFDGQFRKEIPLSDVAAELEEPDFASVALSPAGDRVYTLDVVNRRLWILDRTGAVQSSTDLTAGLTEEVSASLRFRHVDVYDDRVLVPYPLIGQIGLFDLNGRFIKRVGKAGATRCTLGSPVAAALDEAGNLVIIDMLRMFIVRWSPTTDTCLGEYYGFGDHLGYLYYPMDLALDGQGRVYVSQGFEARVQVYEGLEGAAESPERAAAVED